MIRDKIRKDITDEELLSAAPELLRFAVYVAELYEGDPDYTDRIALDLVKPFMTELEK